MKKILCIVILLVGCIAVRAQKKPVFTMDHVALSVTDVDRSANFYHTVLGLQEITNRSKLEGIRWFLIGEGKELHLISIVKEKVAVNKAIHFALTTPDFAAVIESLDKSQISYSDWPGNPNKVNIRADGIRQVFFQDPDGYWIEVNSVAGK